MTFDVRTLHPRHLRIMIETCKDPVMRALAIEERNRRMTLPGFPEVHHKLRTGMLDARKPAIIPRLNVVRKPNPPDKRPSPGCKTAWDSLREQHPENS